MVIPSCRCLILIILTCCSLCDSQAQQRPDSVVFRKEVLTSLLNMPQPAGKLFFVEVSGEWCAPCKLMDRTTFRDSAVANFFNTHFINKKLNGGHTYTDPVSRRLLAMHAYMPNFFFLDQRGTVLFEDAGGKSPVECLQMGNNALQHRGDGRLLAYYDRRYPFIQRNKDSLLLYMSVMHQVGRNTGAALQAYLRFTPEKDYYTDSLIGLMIDYESELGGKAYLFMSVPSNQSLATARTHIPDLGYRMYIACIGLIAQKSGYAIVTRNKALLRRCEQENLHVYQDKAQAEKVNASLERYFGKDELR
jgi:thioredoxin 1